MSKIDEVTKAIHEAMDLMDGLDLPSAERYAQAAIEAMREPTQNMLDIGIELICRGRDDRLSEAWTKMIDAALEGK